MSDIQIGASPNVRYKGSILYPDLARAALDAKGEWVSAPLPNKSRTNEYQLVARALVAELGIEIAVRDGRLYVKVPT